MRPILLVVSALLLVASCDGGAHTAFDEAEIARACSGLPDSMIDQGVAELRSNFDGAAPLRDGAGHDGKKSVPTLIGAVVQVRAAPGMTAQWLGRVLQCDTARHADAALVPVGARTDVVPSATGFTIYIRSSDADVARDIDGRANLFAHPPQARCNTPQYHWNEALNPAGPGHCATDCECDGLRSCTAGLCQGAAR